MKNNPEAQYETYQFHWKDLGDISVGRPNLGPMTTVAVYRLMQYTMRSVLMENFGPIRARLLFVEAGRLAGIEFCKNVLDINLNFNQFIAQLHNKLLELSIGVLAIEKSDIDKLSLVLTVSEDLDCSGLPVNGETVCDYDEGFIAGIFSVYTGKSFEVHEVDCWSTGDRTCRFTVNVVK